MAIVSPEQPTEEHGNTVLQSRLWSLKPGFCLFLSLFTEFYAECLSDQTLYNKKKDCEGSRELGAEFLINEAM